MSPVFCRRWSRSRRREAGRQEWRAPKFNVILQNEIGIGVGVRGEIRDCEKQKGARFLFDLGREAGGQEWRAPKLK